MKAEKRDDYLAQEYLLLQKIIEDFDGRVLSIKAWSVTFGAAALSLAYAQGAPEILLVAAGGAVVFWLVEALWKAKQFAHHRRRDVIEAHFGGGDKTTPFKIGESWRDQFNSRERYWFSLRMLHLPHIAPPHVIVLLAGLLLWLVYPPHKVAAHGETTKAQTSDASR